MAEPITYIYAGEYWNAFTSVFTNLMGNWFYVFIILIVDIAVGLKSRNPILVFIINLLLSAFFVGMIPETIGKIVYVGSALVLALIFFIFFKES